MRDRVTSRPRSVGRSSIFLFAPAILFLAYATSALAQGQIQGPVPAPPTASPSDEVLKNWRDGMAHVPPPHEGCFTSSYPNTQWQEVPCVAGPTIPFPPARGPRPDTAGDGNDPAAGVITGHISTATGSFDSVSGVTSVTSLFGPDDYSLQLNTNTFSSSICSGAGTPAKCQGWQQFIFSNSQCMTGGGNYPCTFMQYWLLGWGKTTCPTGWMFMLNGTDDECFMDSDAVLLPFPPPTIANLRNLSLVGQAVSGGLDTVIFSTGSSLYAVQNSDDVLGLAKGWTAVEYNIVGDGGGSEATFNSGSSMIVRVSVDNGTPSHPTCVGPGFTGFTAEKNNLYFHVFSGTPRSSTEPAIVFTQSSAVTSTLPCDAAVAMPGASKLADTHDLNGDGLSDIVWSDTSGDIAVWLMDGAQVSLPGIAGTAPSNWSIVGQRDFNGDGTYDLLWRDTSGDTSIWFMIGTQVFTSTPVGNVPTTWSVVGVADFNGDGKGDLLWRDSSGNTAVWLMNGASVLSTGSLGNVPITWSVVGTGDFDGDGKADILWCGSSGNTSIWFMNGTAVSTTGSVGNIPTTWTVAGTGDFRGNSSTGIVWRDTSGNTSVWLMDGATVLSTAGIGTVPTNWSLVLTGDFNGDGKSDLLWRDSSGDTSIWFMNGTTVASTGTVGNIPTNWTVQSINAE
jgi:FG-GAP-like repeat